MPICPQCLRICSQKPGEFLEGHFSVTTMCSYVTVFLISSLELFIMDVIFSSLLKSVQEDIHTLWER